MAASREVLFCDIPHLDRIATRDTDPQNFKSEAFSNYGYNFPQDLIIDLPPLSDIEKRVARLRLGLEDGKKYTQKEVSNVIHYSVSSVRRFEKSVREKVILPNS